jgi:hypothetical protein
MVNDGFLSTSRHGVTGVDWDIEEKRNYVQEPKRKVMYSKWI